MQVRTENSLASICRVVPWQEFLISQSSADGTSAYAQGEAVQRLASLHKEEIRPGTRDDQLKVLDLICWPPAQFSHTSGLA